MSPYLLAGPAVALIGIVAILLVMRRKSTEQRSMYSSRRSQIQRKVQAARSRTLAPHGRSNKAPTASEIAAAAPAAPAQPAWEAPVAPRQAWETGPSTSAPVAPPPAYEPPAYTPPAPSAEPPAPAPTFAPAPVEEPSWTPAPAEPAWNPAPASTTPPAPAPAEPASAAPPVSTPAGAGASWSIVGETTVPAAEERAPKSKGKDKDKKKDKQAAATATGSPWSLASGDAPTEAAADEEETVKAPSPMAGLAYYAVVVVGLVAILIGVVVMLANSKVT